MSFGRFSIKKHFQVFTRYASNKSVMNAKHIGPGGFALLVSNQQK